MTKYSYLFDHYGTLPTEIGLMTNVMELAMVGNQFTGSTIPSELGTATGMRWILMSRCGFSGTIPSEIGQLPLLEVLRFQGNDLEGTIPDEIGNLANNASLFDFRVDSGNVMLTGTIPVGLCGVRMVFDCSNFLCGCGCVCSDGNTTSSVVTAPWLWMVMKHCRFVRVGIELGEVQNISKEKIQYVPASY